VFPVKDNGALILLPENQEADQQMQSPSDFPRRSAKPYSVATMSRRCRGIVVLG
jgi:hypothetical protein